MDGAMSPEIALHSPEDPLIIFLMKIAFDSEYFASYLYICLDYEEAVKIHYFKKFLTYGPSIQSWISVPNFGEKLLGCLNHYKLNFIFSIVENKQIHLDLLNCFSFA